MQAHQLRYFIAVIDHGTVNAAALALNVTQPTISQAITKLERELRIDLFHRIGRGMVLTSAGRTLNGVARRIIRDLDAAETSVRDADGHMRGRLDLCTSTALGAFPLAGFIAQMRQAHPRLMVRIKHIGEESTVSALIEDGHCEAVVCHLPVEIGPQQTAVQLGVQEQWLVFPPDTQVPSPGTLALENLPDIPMVVVARGERAERIEGSVVAAGKPRRPSVVTAHRESRLALVMAGLGATIIDRSNAELSRDRGAVVRRPEPEILLPFGIVFNPSSLSKAGRAFVEIATASAAPLRMPKS